MISHVRLLKNAVASCFRWKIYDVKSELQRFTIRSVFWRQLQPSFVLINRIFFQLRLKGKDLCALTEEEFLKLAPYFGEIFLEHLKMLRKEFSSWQYASSDATCSVNGCVSSRAPHINKNFLFGKLLEIVCSDLRMHCDIVEMHSFQ